jgi:hypothetical protein
MNVGLACKTDGGGEQTVKMCKQIRNTRHIREFSKVLNTHNEKWMEL